MSFNLLRLSRRELLLMAAAMSAQIPWSATRAQSPRKSLRQGQSLLSRDRWDRLRSLASIHQGPAADMIHMIVFFDPNCPWCAQLWKTLYAKTPPSPHASAWIPIAYLNDSSGGKALAILRAADPGKALADNFVRFDTVARSGAIEPVGNPSPRERARQQSYNSAWLSLFPASPLIVYRSRDGESYVQVGMPDADDFAALLEELPHESLSTYP
jgi:thiol:disulfide interchange protein DsbG